MAGGGRRLARGPVASAGELARLSREQVRLESSAADFAMQARIARAEQQRLEMRLDRLIREGQAFRRTRRYRLAAAMARPLDMGRRLLDRIGLHHD